MSKQQRPTIAICYDFDGTLSPGNMQEYGYIPRLEITPKAFWGEAKKRAKRFNADEVSIYMQLMLKKAEEKEKKTTREAFNDYGRGLQLFSGVSRWFRRINNFGATQGARIDHFIISSGLKEMIEGNKVAGEFKKIYASSFIYDSNGVAQWPAFVLNYTTKTQFLFRINKGLLNAWDNKRINAFLPDEKRPVPFSRMIFIGDGETDIPCMRLVKEQGGYSIGVYQPHSKKKKLSAEKLLKHGRVNFVAPADYRPGKALDNRIKQVIKMITARYVVQNAEHK